MPKYKTRSTSTLRVEPYKPVVVDSDSETCYIIIRCHGSILWDVPPIQVPHGKEIIKINQAACGHSTFSPPTVDNESTLLFKYVKYMYFLNMHGEPDPSVSKFIYKLPYIDPIYTRKYHEKIVSIRPDERIPSLRDEPLDRVSYVMRHKSHYYNKLYSVVDNNIVERNNGIFIYIKNTGNPYQLENYSIYNIFYKDGLSALMRRYSSRPFSLVSECNSAAKRLRAIDSNPDIYRYITTEFLFLLIKMLPFTDIKILDISCSNVEKDGPFPPDTHESERYKPAEELGYDYSDANPFGYGRYNNKKHKYTNKKSKKRSKVKTHIFKNSSIGI